jgi:hypothetical protein
VALVAPASPPAERWEPAAADVDPEHLVCGLAASLGGSGWRPDQFSRFLDWCAYGGELLPLLLDHQPALITPRSAEPATAGTCLKFASVAPAGDFPGGLLVLAALRPDFAPSILGSMRSHHQWMALSVRGVEYGLLAHGGDLWFFEVSLVSKIGDQADPGALVIGTGRDAAAVWELLTGG